jgi:hypothetical protein
MASGVLQVWFIWAAIYLVMRFRANRSFRPWLHEKVLFTLSAFLWNDSPHSRLQGAIWGFLLFTEKRLIFTSWCLCLSIPLPSILATGTRTQMLGMWRWLIVHTAEHKIAFATACPNSLRQEIEIVLQQQK